MWKIDENIKEVYEKIIYDNRIMLDYPFRMRSYADRTVSRMPHTESEYIGGVTAELSLRTSETGIFAPEGSPVDKFTLTENKTQNGEIVVSCINNSDKMVDNVRLMCVYYLGGIPVGHDEYVYLECEAGDTFGYTFYKPYDSILGDMEFDSYEVYLLNAFNDN